MTTATSIQTEFGYHLEYLDEDGQVLRSCRLKAADFAPAVRHARFDATRLGLVDAFQLLGGEAKVEPLFSDIASSSPRARGFRITIELPDRGNHSCYFDTSYFGSSATRVRAELLRTKEIAADAALYYRFNAFLDQEEPAQPANRLAISLEPVTDHVILDPGCLRDFGPTESWDEPQSGDLPVLVDRDILEEIVAEARADSAREIAGFLLGRLQRDTQSNTAFLVVSGMASACGTTEASEVSVTYTPASFLQAREIATLRGLQERICGWYHSHPFQLCTDCPTPAKPSCIDRILVYSIDDIHLMETTFDQPFMIGLLTAVEPRIEEALGRLPVKLYGWHSGQIQSRGFEVADSAAIHRGLHRQ